MTRRRGCGWAGLAVLALLLGLAVWLTQPLPPAVPPARQLAEMTPARVVNVVDGDTVDIALDGREVRLRYIGIDTPERDEPFYRAATAANRALVGRRTVYLEKDVSETDRYGRLLRYVYTPDGRLVNEILVAEGHAHAATFPPDVRHTARLQAAQQRAQEAGLGMWAKP